MDSESTQQRQPGASIYESDEGFNVAGRYDFRQARRLTDNQLSELEQVTKLFSKDLAENLSALIRRQVTERAITLQQVELLEFCNAASDAALLILLDIQPLSSSAALILDSNLVFCLLEALLGSRTAATSDLKRELTDIEVSVLQDLHGVLLRELEQAWQAFAKLTCQVREQRTTLKPQQLKTLGDTLVAVTVGFEIESSAGQMTLLYPLHIGTLIPHPAGTGRQAESGKGASVKQASVFEQVKNSLLDLDARLQGASLRLEDLSRLRVGDLLRLDVPLDRPMDVLINGKRRFQGHLVESTQKTLLKIQQLVLPL